MFSRKIFLIYIFVVLLQTINSQNINDVLRLSEPGLGIGVRALGMGNAFLSLSDDASGMYFNPAGIGSIKRIEFSGGLDYLKFNNKATFYRNTTDYSNSSTQLNQLSFVFPFPTLRGSLVFGISYNNNKNLTEALSFNGFNSSNTSFIQEEVNYNSDLMYELGLSFPIYVDNAGNRYLTNVSGTSYLYDSTNILGRLNQSGTKINTGSINSWTFSTAIEIYKNLYIGGSLNVISGTFKSNNEYYEDDFNKIYSNIQLDPLDPTTKGFRTFFLNRIIDWELSGWDFKLGFLYQISKIARLGATLQFPKTFTVKEIFSVDAYSEFANSTYNLQYPEDYSDEVEYDIITPFSLGLGGSVNFKGLIVSAEVNLTDYTQTEFDNPKQISQQYINKQNQKIKYQLKAVANLNFGLEYTLPDLGLRVRGGFVMQPSPYKNDPSDYDKKYITGGIGFLADETISFDFGYAHGWWKTFGDNYSSGVSQTNQEISVNKLIVGFSYRF